MTLGTKASSYKMPGLSRNGFVGSRYQNSGSKRVVTEAHAATLDMEERGAAIMGDLARQRETLMRTRGTLGAAREGLEASRRVLRQMGRRAATNKAVLRGIFAVVLLMFLWIAWPSAEAPSPPVG